MDAQQTATTLLAGIDEVGRGPLAGPVVAAAVILPAGIKMIRHPRRSQNLAFWAGVMNCVGLVSWGLCCIGFLTTPIGVYSLMVLADEDVKKLMK